MSSRRSRLSSVARGLAGLGLVVAWAAATAQSSGPGVVLAPKATSLNCLSAPDRNTLVYPEKADRGNGGVLRVRLTFTSRTEAPVAEVFFNSAGEAFQAIVLRHVLAYRFPCLEEGAAPLVATQEFELRLTDEQRIHWNEPRAVWGIEKRLGQCLMPPRQLPEYPYRSLRRDEQGVVLALYTFTDANSPPKVEILYDGSNAEFARVVETYAAMYRIPCMTPADSPVVASQFFRFGIEGESRKAFRNVSLAEFVRGIDRLDETRVRFDFSTMDCPFEIRFRLFEPVMLNDVGQAGGNDPNRREFVEWLRNIDLKLPAKIRKDVFGDVMTISVPCGILDLT